MNRRSARLLVFALVLILGVTAGVAQRRAQSSGRSDFITEWSTLLARPFLVAGQSVGKRARALAQVFRTNLALKHTNAHLTQENQRLRDRLHHTTENAEDLKRTKGLLGLREHLPYQTVGARVLIRPSTPWAQTCTIGKGSADGIRQGAAVLAKDGLVGQVFALQPRTSQVLLLSDQKSSVAAITQRTRAPGICSGDGGAVLNMLYIPLAADIRKGDVVLSSGDGGVFPAGLVVGTVLSIGDAEHEHFRSAVVRPAVEPRSLEEVLVVADGG